MNFLKRLFNIQIHEDTEIEKQDVKLSLDDSFVHNFVKKGGKFLYCLNGEEVIDNLKKVVKPRKEGLKKRIRLFFEMSGHGIGPQRTVKRP